MTQRLAILILLASLTQAACTRTLPPPATPGKDLPWLDVSPPPPVAAQGQVSIDVTEGRAKVTEVLEEQHGNITAGRDYGSWDGKDTRPVCTTPCVAGLAYGIHQLAFERLDDPHAVGTMSVTVSQHPTAARMALGRSECSVAAGVGQVLLTTFGGAAALAGSAFEFAPSNLQSIAPALLIGGGTALLVGVLWSLISPSATEQAAQAIQWEPADGVVYKR